MNSDYEKLKYHIKLLAEALDFNDNPIPHLVIYFDWNRHDLDKAHDIFEKYDQLLREKKNPIWRDLERDLTAMFNINYQDVKFIVLSFYKNKQWQDVCYWFAKSQEPTCPIELCSIITSYKSNDHINHEN